MKHIPGVWVRYGGLNPVRQDHFTDDPALRTYHCPPVRVGLYAFVSGYVELFLVGTPVPLSSPRSKYYRLRDAQGAPLVWNEHVYEETFSKELRLFLKARRIKRAEIHEHDDGTIVARKKPRVFTHKGNLWHHLGEHVPKSDVIKQHDEWVLTSFRVWTEAFRKNRHSCLSLLHAETYGTDVPLWKEVQKFDPFRGTNLPRVCIDHLEVFIEKI